MNNEITSQIHCLKEISAIKDSKNTNKSKDSLHNFLIEIDNKEINIECTDRTLHI